jgi:2-methylcitrate dehydratase PrpD
MCRCSSTPLSQPGAPMSVPTLSGRVGHNVAADLARWAAALAPGPNDLALADRSLRDTLAVAAAARRHPSAGLAARLGDAGQLAMLAHLIDFDDLHIPSTSHISAVCVAAALATGGGAREYLAGAGVMARLGDMLGWTHYDAGWHATCTAGAPAAAVTAGSAIGLDAERLAIAMSLAVPAAGGVNLAFGSDAKSLQVGFAADAGVRAAQLAAAGATSDPVALTQWLELVDGHPRPIDDSPVVPGGIAVKVYPCCYALQRPITAVREAIGDRRPGADAIVRVRVSLAEDVMKPLIHHRPKTGLQGKFSLEYAVAASLLDPVPGLESFTDAAVERRDAQRLLERVELATTPGGSGLLAGVVAVEVELDRHDRLTAEVAVPPGAPDRPLEPNEMRTKVINCAGETDGEEILSVSWSNAPKLAGRLVGEAVSFARDVVSA